MAGLSLTASPLPLGQLSNLSEPQFPRGQSKDNNNYFVGVGSGLNEIMFANVSRDIWKITGSQQIVGIITSIHFFIQ